MSGSIGDHKGEEDREVKISRKGKENLTGAASVWQTEGSEKQESVERQKVE